MERKMKNTADKKDKMSNQFRRQLMYVLIGMSILILAVMVVFLIKNSFNQFTFLGLKWDKQMFGEIPLYHSQVEITTGAGSQISNLYLRNDPRTLNTPDEIIKFKKNIVYVTINDSIGDDCKEGAAAFTDFGKFLASAGITAKLGVMNETLAKEQNMPFVTCDNQQNTTVFAFEGGNETRITGNDSCYRVEVANCEMTKAVETIIVGTILKN